MRRIFRPFILAAMASLFAVAAVATAAPEELVLFDLSDQEEVPAGEPFSRWFRNQGWRNPMGDPLYFFIRDGALHMVSKPGPVYKNRYWLALYDREKLKNRIENKVLIGITSENFRIDPEQHPVLGFIMTPVALPPGDADLRDSAKNDAAFYLIVSFDTPRHDYMGLKMPESIGYVWTNQEWDEPVAGDPDYDAFLRYIPIGSGTEKLGRMQTTTRRIRDDFRTAYPERRDLPDIIDLGVMIDTNTLGGTAESVLHRIWFEKAVGH